VLEGVAYLHVNHVSHRDIKPSNILISKDRQKVALVDFNVAKQVKEGDMLLMYTRSAGTLAFAAPERLIENCVYTEMVDMWACGLVLFMALVGKHPFNQDCTTMQVIEQIRNGEQIVARQIDQAKVSEDVKDLVKSLVKTDPMKRLNSTQALNHPWFKLELQKSNLDDVHLNLQKRKKSKIYNPGQFKERLSINNTEVLRYGLDILDSPQELKKFNSLKGADDLYITMQVRDKQAEIQTDTIEKRNRGHTFAAPGKRPIQPFAAALARKDETYEASSSSQSEQTPDGKKQ